MTEWYFIAVYLPKKMLNDTSRENHVNGFSALSGGLCNFS
jgi:hypothetical protein